MDDFGHLDELILKRIAEYNHNTPVDDTTDNDHLKKIAPVIPVM